MKTTRTFRIRDDHGNYFGGGGHWVQKPQAKIYANTADLPEWIDSVDGTELEKEVFEDGGDQTDIRYYAEGMEDSEALVDVYEEQSFDEGE